MRSRFLPLLLRLAVPVGAVVCLPANGRAQADTPRVRADNPPVWGPRVSLIEAFSIGRADGPPEYALGHVELVAAFGDGTLFLYDAADTVIRRYNPAGST